MHEKNLKNMNKGTPEYTDEELEFIFTNNIKSKLFEFKLDFREIEEGSMIVENKANKTKRNISYLSFNKENIENSNYNEEKTEINQDNPLNMSANI